VIRLAAAVLLLVVVAFPLAVVPQAPVTWLAGAALGVGGAGVALLSVGIVTTGLALAVIAYALALQIAQPTADPLTAGALGATLVVLLALVHLGARLPGAAVGAGVLAGQARQCLGVVAAGVVAASAVTLGGAALGPLLRGATLPVVVAAAALGVLVAGAGVIALVTAREDASPADRV
jgi:hypothetical protein